MRDPGTVQIFDTTLRDGEQSPGATMNVKEKVIIARQLEKLNVDVIEAGFAVSSPGDLESVARVAEAVTRPVVLSLARTRKADIVQAIKSVEKAKRPGIHIFIATSDLHLQRKLRMQRQQALETICWAVEFAKNYLSHIEVSAEDATRSDRGFLCQFYTEVVRVGATVLNVPDTTGYAEPDEFGMLIEILIGHVYKETGLGAGTLTWSVHCHNDLGNAVANSLAGVRHGARQVECTINGIGERAGNASCEQVVMNLRTRADLFSGLHTNVVTEQIYPASRLLAQITGLMVPQNQPIVGTNAFAHEAGIHQDGVLKDTLTYEIIRPEDVGIPSNNLVLGKHSGRAAIIERLKTLGIYAPTVDMNAVFEAFKRLADRKKNIYDEDLLILVASLAIKEAERYRLLSAETTLAVDHSEGGKRKFTATIGLEVDGQRRGLTMEGDGMIDAVFQVISKLTNQRIVLAGYKVRQVAGGAESLGEVTCQIRDHKGRVVSGHGVDTDVVYASALAIVNALNRRALIISYHRRNGGEA